MARASALLPLLLVVSAAAPGCGADVSVPDLSFVTMPDGGWVINGHPFQALGQATVELFSNDGKNTPVGWMVYLADQYNGCAAVMQGLPTTAYLRFQLPVNPVGTFDVNFANTVFGFGRDVEPAAEAQSGRIVVNSHTAQLTSGTYDVVFKSGEHLAGVFAAPFCQ